MVILASYGYKQSQVFNINCKVAPLLELIRRTSHADVCKLLQTRHEQVTQEIADIDSKIEAKEKKLAKLDNPVVEEIKEIPSEVVTKKKSAADLKKFPRTSHGAAEAKKAEEEKKKAEEERKKAEEERKKAEEEKKKAEEAKRKREEAKKGGKKEEVKEISPEELKQQQLDSEKAELRKLILEFNARKIKLQEKLEMINLSIDKFALIPKEIDLIDQNNVRKFLSSRDEELANKILNTRCVYFVVTLENDTFNPYEINGFCIRSIEEDANFVEEPDPKSKKPKTAKKK